jgi:hypothetical protein
VYCSPRCPSVRIKWWHGYPFLARETHGVWVGRLRGSGFGSPVFSLSRIRPQPTTQCGSVSVLAGRGIPHAGGRHWIWQRLGSPGAARMRPAIGFVRGKQPSVAGVGSSIFRSSQVTAFFWRGWSEDIGCASINNALSIAEPENRLLCVMGR